MTATVPAAVPSVPAVLSVRGVPAVPIVQGVPAVPTGQKVPVQVSKRNNMSILCVDGQGHRSKVILPMLIVKAISQW